MDLDLARIYTKTSYSIERFLGLVASQIDASQLTCRIDTSYRRTLVKGIIVEPGRQHHPGAPLGPGPRGVKPGYTRNVINTG